MDQTLANIATVTTIAIALCSALAMFLPPATGPGWYKTLYTVVNMVACNAGHAKNANQP